MGGGEGRKGSGWSGLAGWGTGKGDDGHTSAPPSFHWVEPYPWRLWSNSSSGTASGSAGSKSDDWSKWSCPVSWYASPPSRSNSVWGGPQAGWGSGGSPERPSPRLLVRLHRCALPSGLHPYSPARAPLPRASGAWPFHILWSVRSPSRSALRPPELGPSACVLSGGLLWPLLTSRSAAPYFPSASPFQA
jgi:hypothetical protein